MYIIIYWQLHIHFFLKDFQYILDIYITTNYGVKIQDLVSEFITHKPEVIRCSLAKVLQM